MTFSSSIFRPFGSLIRGGLVLGLMLAGWAGFVATVMWTAEKHPAPFRKAAVARQPLFAVPAALTLLIGVPIVAFSFAKSRGRYRLGPTELEIQRSFLGQESMTVPYASILTVDSSRGPLMRLLGTSDVHIVSKEAPYRFSLFGVRGAGGIREHLLARRDSLLELKKAEEEDSTARAVERLTKVLERVEKRLA